VKVTAGTEDADATYEVSGSDNLHVGSNTVVLTVTAPSGATSTINLTITVPTLSSDNRLDCISVISFYECFADGSSVNEPYGSTGVDVAASAKDAHATVKISGNTNLVPGPNLVTATITAQNGDVATYTLTINVAMSGNNNLSSIFANGQSVERNGILTLSVGTTEVTVSAAAEDTDAIVEVSGNTGLSVGNNTVSIAVTAANGDVANYSFTARVLGLSADSSLSTFTVNGEDALNGGSINVGSSVTEANVVVQTSNANATYEITSGTSLEVGANTITVVVTAENTVATTTYNVTVVRATPLSNNTNLGTITIGQSIVNPDDVYDVDYGTSSLNIYATAEDVTATVEVIGASGLKVGNNTVIVIVTAQDSSKMTYTFTVRVAKSNNTDVTSIEVNGSALDLNSLTATVAAGTTSATIAVVTSDAEAGSSVSDSSLDFGDNSIVVTVTAANGTTTRDYIINVYRTPLSSNTNLGNISVNGNLVAAGDAVIKHAS
jgi:hypothetical protein